MSELIVALEKTDGEHRQALDWFLRNTGRAIPWVRIEAQGAIGFRLATRVKGIYKPHYTQYALSVRQTLDGPYADKRVGRRRDGSWVYPYFQENSDPAQRDKAATNRGLLRCRADGVPVGVLLQIKLKPRSEYIVLGLALVREWNAGYFILEGYGDNPG